MNVQLPFPPIGGTLRGRFDRPANRRVLLVLTAMTTIALTAALCATRNINPMRGDTFEYLHFDPSRTVGYPAFLRIVHLITGELVHAAPTQMILLAGSLLLLGWSFHAFVRRPAFSYAFQAILVGQIAIWKSSAFLMTEGISTALVAIWCAQLLRTIRRFSRGGAILLIAISGVATAVRPSLVALFFGLAVFIVVAAPGRERGRLLLKAGVGLFLSWFATPAALFLVHGSATTTSPFARGVLQHTLYCAQPGATRNADSAFVEDNAAKVRRYIETAPSDVQEQLRRAYSTPLRFGLIIPVLGRRHKLEARSQVDPYLSRIVNERVAANPFCYAGSVGGAYYRMATFDTNRTKQDEQRVRQFMEDHPPVVLPQFPVLPRDDRLARRTAGALHKEVVGLNPERMQLDFSGKVSALTVLPIRLLYGAAATIGLLSLLALVAGMSAQPKHRRLFAGVAALSLAFHLTLAITAVVELGLSRYVVPLWPIVCTLVAGAALSWAERRNIRDNSSPHRVGDDLQPILR